MEIKNKVCKICNVEKPIDEMDICRKYEDRTTYRNVCKYCRSEQAKITMAIWKQKNKDKLQKYKDEHKEKMKNQDFRKAHLDKQKETRRQFPERMLLASAKQRSKLKNLPFNLDLSDIEIPDICPILKIPIFFSNGGKNSPSIDRIDNLKGYVKGNIRIISHLANTMKSHATPEELISFSKNIAEYLSTCKHIGDNKSTYK